MWSTISKSGITKSRVQHWDEYMYDPLLLLGVAISDKMRSAKDVAMGIDRLTT